MKRRPPNPYAALFSMPYCVAAVLVKEHADLDDFGEEALDQSDVLDLASRIEYAVDDTWTEFPRYFSGWVVFRLRNGRIFEAREKFNSGSPEQPLAAAAIVEKFERNAGRRVLEHSAALIMEYGQRLDQLTTVEPLMEACGAVGEKGVAASRRN